MYVIGGRVEDRDFWTPSDPVARVRVRFFRTSAWWKTPWLETRMIQDNNFPVWNERLTFRTDVPDLV